MTNAARTYDWVVIGGGPAGIVAAVTGIAAGRSVALVDAQRGLGGAGVNTGTIPSKTLRETALALSGMRSRELYGVDLSLRREATVADFLRHQQNVRSAFNALIEDELEAARALLLRGYGTFVDPHTLEVHLPAEAGQAEREPVRLRGERFLVATGSSPTRPPAFPFDAPQVYDSDTILDLRRLPKSLAVIGAGAVGCEYASTFAALETEVHVIDGRDALLPFLDSEVSRGLTVAMERQGVRFHWGARAGACRIVDDRAVVELASGEALTVDAVLVCAGRTANTQRLGLEAAGLDGGKRGRLVVDDDMRTSVPHIYAAGDVIGPPALASMSMDQGRRAARHALLGETSKVRSELLPTGIYTIPEASMVGLTEEALRAQRIDYVVGRALYRADARGRIIGDPDGFLKLLFRASDMRLLGVHVLGEQATELVHIGLMAMLADASADIFHEACFNFPTLAGLYKTASFDAALRAGKSRALAATPTQF